MNRSANFLLRRALGMLARVRHATRRRQHSHRRASESSHRHAFRTFAPTRV